MRSDDMQDVHHDGAEEERPVERHVLPTLPNEFEIEVGGAGEPWVGSNGRAAVTVYPDGKDTSKKLHHNGAPVYMFKANVIRNACTPMARKEQCLIAELNGVFVHVQDKDGMISIVVAPERMRF